MGRHLPEQRLFHFCDRCDLLREGEKLVVAQNSFLKVKVRRSPVQAAGYRLYTVQYRVRVVQFVLYNLYCCTGLGFSVPHHSSCRELYRAVQLYSDLTCSCSIYSVTASKPAHRLLGFVSIQPSLFLPLSSPLLIPHVPPHVPPHPRPPPPLLKP